MKKICFMLLGNPPSNNTDMSEHWLKFIDRIDNTSCVFVNHPMNKINKEELEDYKKKYDYMTAFEKKLGSENMYICNLDDNTHIKTMWANISIVYAEIMMLQESIIKFGLCEKYILLSLSCCPLYNYNTIYETLCSDDKSWISFMSMTPFVTKGVTDLYTMSPKEQLDKTSDIFNYYAGLKVSQWMVLSGKHVRYIYSLSTLEQRERTYLYDGELECKQGTVTKIKYNDSLKDTNCDKDNCIDDIKKLIGVFDRIIKSEMPNCVFTPYDEYAIQQFILNKILNNADKNKYLTNMTELLKILQREFRIMSFEYIKANLETNYSKLNKQIKNVELDFYYNEPSMSMVYEDNTANKIMLGNYPSIIAQSDNLVKNSKKMNTYNVIYFGRKFTTYPCHSIRFPPYQELNKKQNCEKNELNDYIFISSTYTNWLLVTNNLSNYSRSINFKEILTEKEIDDRILKNIFSNKKKNKKIFDQYLTYIKKNTPLYYESQISDCMKKIYDSDVDLPDDFDEHIEYFKSGLFGQTPPSPPNEQLAKNYHLNHELKFDMQLNMSPFFLLTESDSEITEYSSLQDFLTKMYTLYKKYDCEPFQLNNLVLQSIKIVIFDELSSPGIDISYHPCEYFTTINEKNMFVNVSNYLQKISCFIKDNGHVTNDNNNYATFEKFIEKYKLPSLLIEKYGNPLDKYTLIPVLLSGALFVRKCGNGCSINNFTEDLFAMDYIYKDYVLEDYAVQDVKDTINAESEPSTYLNKYLKYKNKYLQLKNKKN